MTQARTKELSRRRGLGALLAVGAMGVLAACGQQASVAVEGGSPTAGDADGSLDTASLPAGDSRAAPDFTFSAYPGTDSLGGDELRFSEVLALGRPVVLNFWAGLCAPCRVEMPDIQRVHEDLAARVTVVGVDIGPFTGLGSREQGQELLVELGVSYPVGTTFDRSVLSEYRVLGMPSTFFISPKGTIVRQWTGLLTEQSLLDLIDELEAASSAE